MSYSFKSVVLLLAILASGAGAVWWAVAQADHEMRGDLLDQTQLLANTLDIGDLNELTGSQADLESPQYQRLKDGFAAIRSGYPQCRLIYLIGRQEERGAAEPPSAPVCYFVDVGTEYPAQPGQAYASVSDPLKVAFDTGMAFVEGPLADERGNWISGMVPLTNAHSKGLRAVLGMSMNARDWNRKLLRAALPFGLLTLALAALQGGGALVLAWRARRSATAPFWLRNLELVLASAAGLALTIGLSWMAHRQEMRNRQEDFSQLVAGRTEVVADHLLSIQRNELEGLANFYKSHEVLDSKELQIFSTYLARNSAVRGWELVPAVPAADKAAFEARVRAAGDKDFEIWQKDEQGRRVPASGRNVFFPIQQVAPMTGSSPVLGYDLGSEPGCHEALEAAARSGLSTSSKPVTMVQEGHEGRMLVIFQPVHDAGEVPRFRGFAVATLPLDRLLQRVAQDDSAYLEIALVHDDEAPEILAKEWDAAYPTGANLAITRPVLAFGKAFTVGALAGPGFIRLHPLRATWWSAIIGLVLTTAFVIRLKERLQEHTRLERLVAERSRELLESEQFAQETINALSGSLVILDENGIVISVNRSWRDFARANFGNEATVCEGTNYFEAWSKNVEDETSEPNDFAVGFCAVIEGRQDQFSMEYACHSPGEQRWFLANVTRFSNGKKTYIVVIHDNITRQKRTSMMLSASEERFALTLEAVNDGLWDWNMLTGTAYFSPKYYTLLGYDVGEFPANYESWRALVQREDLDRLEGELQQSIETGNRYTTDIRMKSKSGEWVWISTRGKVVGRDSHGNATRMVGTHSDITEQKQAEEELRHAKQLADQANTAKLQFLATMSHEIRPPMNGIIGMTIQLLDNPLPPAQRERVEIVQTSAEALLSVINDILDFSKIEAGKLDLESVDFDLAALLKNLACLFAPQADKKGLALRCDISPDVPRCLCGTQPDSAKSCSIWSAMPSSSRPTAPSA